MRCRHHPPLPRKLKKAGPSLASEELQSSPQDLENTSSALAPAAQPDAPWSSAAKARSFLEALSQTRSPGAFARFWRARRGDFYLAVAVILVLVAIRLGNVVEPFRASHRRGAHSGWQCTAA